MLAPYALHPEQSRGRRHPEHTHPYREPFQRDRDRVIHSRAFRRLEDKTQVFTHRFSDHFRNRLTHTIEVAQISRTIARELKLNEDFAECLALVHDIGHPPFGHAGERALDREMRNHGSFFDHNIHALRIVEFFELRYPDFRGLNLTFEVREGIIKHSRDYRAAEYPDLAEYLLEKRPPIEAQIIDLTDEIAYNTADLDDGVEAGILTIDQIRDGIPIFRILYQQVDREYPGALPKLKFSEAVRRLFNRMVGDLIEELRIRIEKANLEHVEDVRRLPHRLACFSTEVEEERRETKDFLTANLYQSSELLAERSRFDGVIEESFRFWLEHPEQLPASYREQMKETPLPRIICDYIAGMTDRYLLEQHEAMQSRSAAKK